MKLRSKLLWTLLPLLMAIGVGGWVASYATARIAHSAHAILTDNYRSVLAAQRMKEAIERMDSGAMFVLVGHRDQGIEQARLYRDLFEEELRVEESNITETGESEAALALRQLWSTYQTTFDAFAAAPPHPRLADAYWQRLYPVFIAIKDRADVVLAMNQDAMMRKSEAADAQAAELRMVIMGFVLAACAMAFGLSTLAIARILRPLAVVAQTTRRIAKGDLLARARVEGHDEVADLAHELNAMADQLSAYQRSSLGELLEAQQAAQAAVDSLPDPVIVYTHGGRLLHVNRAAQALMPQDEEGVPSFADARLRQAVQNMREHVEGGRGAYAPAGLQAALAVATTPVATHYLPRAMPLYGPDHDIIGTTVVLQDVTRLVRFDELKDDLVATVAHELRTPLTSLQMALHLCAEETVGPLNEKQADMLYAAREDCARLQATVNELLDLSRIQAGSIKLNVRQIAPQQLTSQAVEAQQAQAQGAGVHLRVEIAPGTPSVAVDPERLHLAFDNLLSNAIRYTPKGGEVLLRVRPENDAVRFEVHDAGPGVPAAFRGAIFERYVQVPDHPAGRAGLGLFIAREVVQAHGGTIGVMPREGGGSIFWLQLPVAGADFDA